MSGSSHLSKAVFSLAVFAACVFAPVSAQAETPTIPASVRIPDLSQLDVSGPVAAFETKGHRIPLYGKEPDVKVSPAFIVFDGTLTTKEKPSRAIYEWNYTLGRNVTDESTDMDFAVAKVQIEKVGLGGAYDAILLLVDGNPLYVAKDFETGVFYGHALVDNGVKASICQSYDSQTGELAQCSPISPLFSKAQLSELGAKIRKSGEDHFIKAYTAGLLNRDSQKETIEARRESSQSGAATKKSFIEQWRKNLDAIKCGG